jgi:hypothetical protein
MGALTTVPGRLVGPGQRHERFVTQRCHDVGLGSAGTLLENRLAAVRSAGYEDLSVEREFVVHDSDITVDDGWTERVAGR